MPSLIRTFVPGDLPSLAPFIVSIQNGEFGIPITAADQPDLADIERFYFAPGGHFWVAEDRGVIVGTLGLLSIGHHELALRKMFVAPSHRGREHGVAQRLLDIAIAWATSGEFTRILLGTTEAFLAAHRFYEKNSFAPIAIDALPSHFPRMPLDTRFYQRAMVGSSANPGQPAE